jgi:hypothetical protein
LPVRLTVTLASGAKLKANIPRPPIEDLMSDPLIRTAMAAPSCGGGSLPRFGFRVWMYTP